MKVRIISSAIGVAAVLIIIFLSNTYPITMTLFISLASVISVSEVLNAKKLLQNKPISIVSLAAAFCIPILTSCHLSLPVSIVYIFIMCILMLVFNKPNSFDEYIFSSSMTLLISHSLSSCVALYTLDQKNIVFYIFIMLCMPWLTDSCAYFAGISLGKRKLCPNISPKKTVEGAIGGVIGGTALTMLVGLIFQNVVFPAMGNDSTINFIALFIYAFLGTFVSMVGDLTFSVIKRSCNIKDYGHIIPGHGGINDRIDSVLFTMPLMYFISTYIMKIVNL